jgi:hypothetical protein
MENLIIKNLYQKKFKIQFETKVVILYNDSYACV